LLKIKVKQIIKGSCIVTGGIGWVNKFQKETKNIKREALSSKKAFFIAC